MVKNVSCEYDRRVVEAQLCKLRDASDTLTGRAFAMFHWSYGVEIVLWHPRTPNCQSVRGTGSISY